MKNSDLEYNFQEYILNLTKKEINEMFQELEDAMEAYYLAEYLSFNWESVRK